MLLATVAAMLDVSVGLGVDWTVSRGAHRLLTNIPSSRQLTLPSFLTDLPAATPGGVGAGPWCYTSDPNVRWEYCDIPQCSKSWVQL